MKRPLLSLLTTALVLASGSARADGNAPDKAACVAQLDNAQTLQSAKKLREARASLISCSNDACPDVVREDCARTLVSLDANMPSAVFSAVAETGDVTDVRVVLDGELAAERLDGTAITVDPGEHVARFIRAGRQPVEVRFVAREGEKNRLVSASFGAPRSLAPTPVRVEGTRRSPLLPLLLAGTGVAALGTGLGFRLKADADARDMQSSCAPSCSQGARDALSDKLAVSNVSLAIGLGALAASGIVWLVDSNNR